MDNSLYQTLGLSPAATAEQIKDAYRQLVRLHHPDANPQRREAAEALMKDVLVAYATLSDPRKRARYDTELKLREFEIGAETGTEARTDSGTVQVMHHPSSYSASASGASSLVGKVRAALKLSLPQFAARIGVSERDLIGFEARDAMPQSPIQLRTFAQLVEKAAKHLENTGRTSDATDLRTALGRKKAGRNFLR
ncbi:MAG TPA: J domain-containing protein [Abditibacterium sp.]|jgi:curved DNA-binding protein CbpA